MEQNKKNKGIKFGSLVKSGYLRHLTVNSLTVSLRRSPPYSRKLFYTQLVSPGERVLQRQ